MRLAHLLPILVSIVAIDALAMGPTATGHLSLIEFTVQLADDNPGDSAAAEVAEVKVTVNWEGITSEWFLFGTID